MSQRAVVSIIDDDASVRAGINRLVRSLGYVARTFQSAEQFLRSPELDTSSCLIVDVQMPHMSGLELQHVLRSRKRDLPVIFITAFPESDVRAQALEHGAIAFLAKPLDGPTLDKHIHLALDKAGGGRQG